MAREYLSILSKVFGGIQQKFRIGYKSTFRDFLDLTDFFRFTLKIQKICVTVEFFMMVALDRNNYKNREKYQ